MRSGPMPSALSLRVLLLICLLGALALPAPTAASALPDRPQQAAGAAENQFLLLYPDLRQAPAPAWLRPAVRVTYSFAYATFARAYDDPTPSGSGLLQYDVVAQDRRTVVANATMYGAQGQGAPPTALTTSAGIPGVGDFWFSPRVLAHAEDAAGDDFAVNRLQDEVEGVTYDVVRMQSTTDRMVEVWEFEAGTGILVSHQQMLYGADGEKTSGNVMTLVDRRQVKLPWRFGSVPTWVKRGAEINLTGSQTMDLGSPPYIPLPMAVAERIDKVGSLWSEHTQTVWVNNMQIGQTRSATGVAQLAGGLWLPPEALGVLKAGAVLDRDPDTGMETSVEEATKRQIVISAAGPDYLIRYTYDGKTGRLIGFYQEAHMLAGVQYTELQGE